MHVPLLLVMLVPLNRTDNQDKKKRKEEKKKVRDEIGSDGGGTKI